MEPSEILWNGLHYRRSNKNYVLWPDAPATGKVSGLLLYAKTGETITPDCTFNMGGNQIGAKTLDLNTDFRVIAAQLDRIAGQYFGKRDKR